jgi:hypothetical protein
MNFNGKPSSFLAFDFVQFDSFAFAISSSSSGLSIRGFFAGGLLGILITLLIC